MKVSVKVEGIESVGQMLGAVHDSVQARKMEQVLLAEGARPIRDEWKQRAPRRTGKLRANIKARIGKRSGNWIASAFAAIGRKKTEAPHANLILSGARPHVIASTAKRAVHVGSGFFRWVRHPGFRAIDFTDAGLAAVETQVQENVAAGLAALIDKAAK